VTSAWNPAQYERFKDERSRPFFDLLALLSAGTQPDTFPALSPRVVDLGCGTGELTRELHRRVRAAETLGIDSSAEMLAKSAAFAGDGLRFERRDIADFADAAGFDVVFSNAALQWLPDHAQLFARVASLVRPGGQLAVQMPANHDHVSHITAHDVAREDPFRAALGGHERVSPVLAPETYAEMLHRLGFAEQHVRLQVYAHTLASRDEVIEWVRGTMLTDYQKRLPPELFVRFVARYRELLSTRLADERPFLFPFKRILLWGRRPR
jgi:trans-aconitate 2-methyltransferase